MRVGPRPPRKYAGPTQDKVNLRWCQPRLELAFTAISLPHLTAIERQVLLLVDTEGLPIGPQPYVNFATALWDSASLVRASPSRPHNPPLPKPCVCLGRRSWVCSLRRPRSLRPFFSEFARLKKLAQFNSLFSYARGMRWVSSELRPSGTTDNTR